MMTIHQTETNRPMYEEHIAIARTDLKILSDDEFVRKYRASKRRYQAVTKSLDWLHELRETLEDAEDLHIDGEVIDDIEMLSKDLIDILDRMHSTNVWMDDEDDE